MLRDLKVKRLGILYSNEEYGREEQKLLSRGFVDNGGAVSVQSFDLKDTISGGRSTLSRTGTQSSWPRLAQA